MKLTIQHYNVSFLYALLSESTGKCFDLVKEFAIGIHFLGVGYRAIEIDGNRVAMTVEYMPVNTIVASRYLTIGKPLPTVVRDTIIECLLSQLNSGGEWFVPVEMLGLMPPEFFRIFETMPQHFVLNVMIFADVRHGW